MIKLSITPKIEDDIQSIIKQFNLDGYQVELIQRNINTGREVFLKILIPIGTSGGENAGRLIHNLQKTLQSFKSLFCHSKGV